MDFSEKLKAAARKGRPLLRHLADRFGVPHFHRFEVVIMRVLFAVVIFQTLPLGHPWSSWTQTFVEDHVAPGTLTAVLAEEERDEMLRPPLLPISQMLPNSQGKLNFDKQDKANGIAHLVDLTFFSDEKFVKTLPWIVLPCLLLYAVGVGLPVVLPILTLLQIGARTLFNSQGSIHHGYQMVSLVMLVQTGIVLWHCWGNWKEAMGIKRPKLVNGRNFWDSFVRYSQYMVIGCYVIAGVIKPINSDGEWFKNSHMIGIQLVKTDRQNYYSELDSKYGNDPVPYAEAMLKHPNWTRIFLAMGVLLEIFAFLALYNRLASLVFGLMFILFHYFNEFLMNLVFPNNEKLVWIFLINLPFWIWAALTYRKRIPPDAAMVGEVVAEPAA
jgi:hypothetical protein